MKSRVFILFLLFAGAVSAATHKQLSTGGQRHLDSLMVRIDDKGDTLFLAYLHDVYVYPPLRFKNRQQERFYWRTVRDVKLCLPIARSIMKEMEIADRELAAREGDRKAQKKWWHQFERQLYKKYESQFRNMYASQGRMLMLLMARESNRTSYELIKKYKSKSAADFWQFIAKLFKNDLKEDYNGNDKDRIVERVINLVEAGQL